MILPSENPTSGANNPFSDRRPSFNVLTPTPGPTPDKKQGHSTSMDDLSLGTIKEIKICELVEKHATMIASEKRPACKLFVDNKAVRQTEHYYQYTNYKLLSTFNYDCKQCLIGYQHAAMTKLCT